MAAEDMNQQASEFAFNVETFLPPGATIAVYRFAETLSISTSHVRRLIESAEIKVPDEEIERAKSKAKSWPTVRIPRENAIDFLRRRYTGTRVGKNGVKEEQRKGLAKKP